MEQNQIYLRYLVEINSFIIFWEQRFKSLLRNCSGKPWRRERFKDLTGQPSAIDSEEKYILIRLVRGRGLARLHER